ncbi:MAG: triose-phosphate isomerase [Candidatus Woesearchaeota archaeon]
MFFSKRIKSIDFSRPIIVLNFKTYTESSGINALKLAKIAEKVSLKTSLNIIIAVQAIDLKEISSNVSIPVFAQHVDPFMPGKSTGSIIIENLSSNIKGSILNHSEKKIPLKVISETINRLRDSGLKSIVCASNNIEAKKISALRPDFIAVEPPELIGGEVSVSDAKPEIIKKAVNSCMGIPVLAGAGIKNNEDLKIALSLGCRGVLLSSHFVKAKDPKNFLEELIKET